MKVIQLFKSHKFSETDLHQFLSCYGFENGLHDRRIFNRDSLENIKTIEKLENMQHVLLKYYLPCKAKIYLNNLTYKRAITILRQVLRLHNYYLNKVERNVLNRKEVYYSISCMQPLLSKHVSCINSNVTLEFS